MADQEKGGDLLVVLQRLFDAGNDNAAAVVAAHDIHCNSHGKITKVSNSGTAESAFAVGCRSWMWMFINQAPAVTLMTWRPL